MSAKIEVIITLDDGRMVTSVRVVEETFPRVFSLGRGVDRAGSAAIKALELDDSEDVPEHE